MPTGGEALVADGRIELNREMVRQGWALAYYPEHGAVPGPAYDAEQLQAAQAQRGLVVRKLHRAVGVAAVT